VWLSRFWISLPIFLLLVGLAGGSGPLIGFAVFLFGAGALARYWSRHALDRVVYEHVLPENRAFAGESLKITLRLANDKFLPLPWLQIRESTPEGVDVDSRHVSPVGYQGYVQVTHSTHLSWYERVTWSMNYKAAVRGYYRIGPARLASGDIFGFFPVERDDTLVDPIIVYPKLVDLPSLGLPPDRPFGEMKGRQRIFEDPGRIAGLRDYRPGDPMRRIDWKASAKLGALQSKVYEPSGTLHMLIVLNVNTMEHVWEGFVPELFERLISLTGSVARQGFGDGYSIGLATNGSFPESDRPLRVPVGRHADQLARVLEALAVIGPFTLGTIDSVIDREAQRFPLGATLVLITSRMDPTIATSLLRVSHSGHAVTVLSLAERQDVAAMLPGIKVFDLSQTMPSQDFARR
jgi:uncharacterized protein (DUF58 family)